MFSFCAPVGRKLNSRRQKQAIKINNLKSAIYGFCERDQSLKNKLGTVLAIVSATSKLVRFTDERSGMLIIGIIEHGGKASPPSHKVLRKPDCGDFVGVNLKH